MPKYFQTQTFPDTNWSLKEMKTFMASIKTGTIQALKEKILHVFTNAVAIVLLN